MIILLLLLLRKGSIVEGILERGTVGNIFFGIGSINVLEIGSVFIPVNILFIFLHLVEAGHTPEHNLITVPYKVQIVSLEKLLALLAL